MSTTSNVCEIEAGTVAGALVTNSRRKGQEKPPGWSQPPATPTPSGVRPGQNNPANGGK